MGTDAGYFADPDPIRAYELMRDPGLSFAQFCEALRKHRLRPSSEQPPGRIVPGYEAHLVVISGDTEKEITALMQVALTYERGRAVYGRMR